MESAEVTTLYDYLVRIIEARDFSLPEPSNLTVLSCKVSVGDTGIETEQVSISEGTALWNESFCLVFSQANIRIQIFAWDQGVPTLVGETSVAFDSLTLSVPEDSWFSISDVSGGESFSIVGQVHLSLTVTPSNREELSRNVFGDALPPTISAPPPPLPSVPKPHLEESEEASAAPHPATVHTLFPEKLPTYAWDVHKKPTKPAKPVKPAKPAKPLPPTPKRPLPPVPQRTHAEQMAKPSPPTKPAKPMKPLPALPPKVSKPLPSLPAHRELPQPPAKVQTEDPAESMKPEEVTEPIEPAHELAAEPKIERELEAIQSELEKQPTVEVEKEEIAEETA